MTAPALLTHAHIDADMKRFCGSPAFYADGLRSVLRRLAAKARAAARSHHAASSIRAMASAAARALRFGTTLGGVMAMAGPCFVCGTPVAPFGFGWPGPARDKPKDKRGYLWACFEHRQDGERRREAAIAAFSGRGAITPDHPPSNLQRGSQQ